MRNWMVFATPLVFMVLAYGFNLMEARTFRERMVHDRNQLDGQLVAHGMSREQAEDVRSWNVVLEANVTAYVGGIAQTSVVTTAFLGIALAAAFVRKPRADG